MQDVYSVAAAENLKIFHGFGVLRREQFDFWSGQKINFRYFCFAKHTPIIPKEYTAEL